MKTSFRVLPWLIVAALLYFLTQCQRDCPETLTVTNTITKIDTVFIQGKTVYYQKPYEVIKTEYMIGDTVRVLSNYTDIKKYNLPVMNDSNGKVNLFATVTMNEIKDWTYKAEIYPKTIIKEKYIVIKAVNRIRPVAGVLLTSNFGISPTIGATFKRHNFLAGYDLVNKNITAGYLIRF